jgi:hypothetical protein
MKTVDYFRQRLLLRVDPLRPTSSRPGPASRFSLGPDGALVFSTDFTPGLEMAVCGERQRSSAAAEATLKREFLSEINCRTLLLAR